MTSIAIPLARALLLPHRKRPWQKKRIREPAYCHTGDMQALFLMESFCVNVNATKAILLQEIAVILFVRGDFCNI